ncbi:MAG: hypothetical protein ACFCD0_26265 [Gemmataceae bacterium]
MMAIAKKWPIASVLGLMLVVGCGQGPEVVPVRGVVTLDGKPLKKVYVQFIPQTTKDGHPGSYATTDDKGQFELRLYQAVGNHSHGAVVGKHTVVLRDTDRPVRPPIPPPKVAPKYSEPTKSPLQIEVSEPTNLSLMVDRRGEVSIQPEGQ